MKIKFSNLGSIKETELDLRPLTVIIGPNNSNKTYIAYCVYGLWKQFISTVSSKLMDSIDLKKESVNKLSIKKEQLINLFIEGHNRKIDDFRENLDKYFQDSNGKLFVNTNFEIKLSEEKVRQAIELIVEQENLNSLLEEDLSISSSGDTLYISFAKNIDTSISEETRIKLTAISLIIALSEQLFPTPFILPAERNAFIIHYKMLANRRFNLLRENRRELIRKSEDDIKRQFDILREQGDISYPEPIEDFLEFLTNAEFNKNVKLNPASKNEFQKLADKIEYYIINKNKVFYEPTVLEGKEIKVRVNKDLTIYLHNASSSIKQLTPLLLYLRYRAKKNDLLIIDEPEMNLHPESQTKLLEIFGILVNLGINVLITTHSPYFMAHLNNLINKNTDAKLLKKQAGSLYLKDSRAFLPLEQVSAYEMQDNKLVSLKDEEENMISWNTLSDTSFDIQRRYFELDEIEEKYGKK